MVGKNNQFLLQQRKGQKFEKYSIKKLKVGAASVLVGAGFFFGYHVEASEVTEPKTIVVTEQNTSVDKEISKPTTVENNTKTEVISTAIPTVVETPKSQEATVEQKIQTTELQEKVSALQVEVNRIRANEKQKSHIEQAEKLIEEAKELQASKTATQQEVNAKAKEISSLTTILKSMKAEETVKENKNQDSRNGKKMQEGTGFREGGATGTGISADVVDATSTPAVARGEYTKREDAEAFTKQVTWLDFGDVAHWENIDNEGGKIYLKEGSIYSKEVIPGYVINIKVKSLKPFQATEIYRKRMEAANASEEEKATFNPNATNQHFGEGSGPSRVTADQQDGTWSEVRNNGIDTGNKKTSIGAGDWSNIGVQFEISATYKGKNVRPAVIMNDSESANHGENIVLTTNGSPWERVLELKKERFVGGTFTPTPYKPINNYNLRHEDYPQSGGQNNANQLLGAMRDGLLTLADGTKFAPKYMTNPDQEMGGLGTGVFGPVTSSGGYSLPILMTKDATEVGLYILSGGVQTAMMGVIPIDEGDAPESYGKASHTINTVNGVTGGEVKQPYLGSTRPDMDTGTTKDWYGDDKDIDADEGINQLLPDNLKDSEGNIIKANISKKGYYKLNVQAHTGGAEKAYIRSWIDFNNNGKFDEDEGSEIAEITKDGEVSLEFKNKSSRDAGDLLEAGTRVRIATNKAEIENPTGNAFSGEVEDFKTKITHPPKGEKKETVGNIKETQKEEIHFTVADGKKNVYVDGNPSVEIDKNVAPVYFDNKTGQQVTLSSDNTYTVEGEGTYKFIVAENGIDVKVEFTPADGFIGKAHGVSIRRQDTNKITTDWGVFNPTNDPSITNINSVLDSMDGMYIPEVRVPGEVTTSANNAESKNLQGLPQKGQPTFNVETAKNPVTPSAKYPAKLVDPATGTETTATTVNALEQGTNKVIGTYTIVPETGEVTFTPNKDFTGVPAPVTVSAEVELSHDKDGNITKKTLTGTYTPTIIPVTPTSENAKSEGIQGATQEGTPTFTAGKANVGTEENPVEKTVPITISATNPAKFVVDGNPVETTTIPAKEGDKEVGTYTIEPATGKVTFTPNKDYHGTPTPVTVQAKDDNGTPATATYSPVVKPAVPTADNQKTTDVQGAKQTATPVFTPGKNTVNDVETEVPFEPTSKAKLIDPSKTGEEAEVTSLEVPNQGTYTIDDNGVVTFTPLPTFTGEATPVSIVRKDKNGTPATATYTPKVVGVTPKGENAKSEGIQGATQEGTPTFTAGKANVGTEENPVEKTVPITISATNPAKFVVDGNPVETTTIPAKEGDKEVGTYTIEPATGKVTFTPNKDYHGTPTPVTVQAKDDNGTPATATYSPVVKPAVPTADNQKTTDVQGAKQTATPVFTPGKNTVNDVETEVPFEPTSKAKLIDPSKTGEEAEVTSLEVPNQGTYTIDDNGVVTFTPLPTFTGEATPVSIVRKDKNGTPATATYTPKVVGVTPTGENVNTEGIQGATQEGTPTFTAGKANVGTEENPVEKTVPITISATNPAKFVVDGNPVETTTIPAKEGDKEVGTYTIEPATGKVTFTPNKDYHGTPTPVTVQAKDDNGTPATATYSPVVKPAVPTADNQKTTDVQGAKQTATPVFTPGKNTVNDVETEVPFEPTSKAKLIDPSKTGEEAEVTSLEVPNQGTYTIDDNGVVTFTPLPTFTGEATPVSIVRKDKNGTPATATYTPKVVGVTPTGENVNTEGIQGATQEGTPTFTAGKANVGTEENPVEKTVPITISATNPAKFVVDGNPVETTTIPAKEGDKEVGTYTIEPATGKVTFTPNKDYHGTPTPVTVQAKDDNGTPATATYSPVVKPAVPTADNQKTTDVQGAKQTATPVFTPGKNTVNDVETEVPFEPTSKAKLIDPSKTGEEAEVTSLEVPNQGTYTIDDNGVVTFTPLPTFTGEATPVSIVRKDKNGTPATATYTPKVVGVTPTGENVNTEGIQGATQEGTPTFTAGKANVGTEENPVEKTVPITISATNPAKFVVDGNPVETTTIPAKEGDKEVGTYTIEPATGKVTFTPNKDYHGTPTPVTVQAKDDNGTPATATYSPVVKPAVPTADNQKTTDVQGAKQTATPVFTPGKNTVNDVETEVPFEPTSKAKLIDPSKTGEEAEVTSLEVPNQGTYTIDDNGVVTFTPLPTFTGEATPVSIVRKDKNGTPATATYTPKVVGVTPKGENAKSEGIQGATQEGTPTFTAGKANVGTEENPVEKTVPITISATNPAKFVVDGNPVETTTIPAKEGDKEVGTYTIEPATGKVTFTPNKDYHGTPTPVTVQAKDDNGTPATATYSPTVTPVTPEGTAAETTGIQGATQEGTPTFKPGNPNVPIDEEVAPTLEGANPEGKVVVPGEGTYTVDKDGKVTFTPEPQFTGAAKGVTVKRVDKNGTPVTAKYTPTVTPVTPEGTAAETTGIQGATQEGTPTFKPGNPNVPIDEEVAPTLEGANPEGKVVVPGEGTYTVDKDGKVTFTPEPQFTGTAKGVTVKRVDKNGTPVTAKYTPTVTPVTPTGENAETEGPKAKPQTSTIVFDKKDQDNTTVNFDKGHENVALDPTTTTLVGKDAKPTTEVKVPGEGTYTLANNVITFTPEPDFAGKATGVTVQVKDVNGTKVEKTYTPTVRPVTTFVDEAGNPITVDKNNTPVVPEEDGTLPKKDIHGYTFKETKKDAKGNTIHVYQKVSTPRGENESTGNNTSKENKPSEKGIIRDKDGNPIPGFEYDRMSPILDIPEYVYVETVTDPDGTVRHIYRPIETVYKDKDGNPIPNVVSKEKGTKESKAILGYRIVGTKKLPNGDVEHVYEKVQATTTWVNELGNVIQSTEEGLLNPSEIPGYEFVRTETDAYGNVRHVYRRIATSQTTVKLSTTVEQRKNELPNTGTGEEFIIFSAAATSIITGLGLSISDKKKEEE